MKYVDIFYLLIVFEYVDCYVESYISGGSYAKYEQYPHSVFLDINCDLRGEIVCGGSILNQKIVLTAAHCVEFSASEVNRIIVRYGHEDIREMKWTKMANFRRHESYDEERVINDICLISTKHIISLNKKVKRVILMKNPILPKYAYVAGWGMDESFYMQTMLKDVSARLQPRELCEQTMGQLHGGIFCAGPVTGVGAALQGDSGGALVINGYIQIGLVSYKLRSYSLVAYTNVSYYLSWIKKNAKLVYCNN